MNTLETTPWFPGDVKPAHPGVYQRFFPHRAMFAEWTGCQWLLASSSPRAAKRRKLASGQQDTVRWRGLVRNPKATP